jgi:dynein heavy chain
MLSSGWVPDMFPKEEKDALLGKVRSAAKSNGYQDTPD